MLIVANFIEEINSSRPYQAYRYFVERGFLTKVLYSDFSHSSKTYRFINNPDFIAIASLKYNSNISLRRFVSHFLFSQKVKEYLKTNKFNFIYVNLPPNYLGYLISKKKYSDFIFIADIIDLWPESFPLPSLVKNIFIFKIFKRLRDTVLRNADIIITESDYFYKYLNLNFYQNSHRIYLSRTEPLKKNKTGITKEFSIAYLGNIGNIYDFSSLVYILDTLQKVREVSLHIIGKGDLEKWLINELNKKSIKIYNYGVSFDDNFKCEIISKCWFGYNGYKHTSEVALSYKSIDYFAYGIPIINSAKGDTYNLVKKENVGVNFNSKKLDELILIFEKLDLMDIYQMRINVQRVFNKYFSLESYFSQMDKIIEGKKLI